MPRLEIKSRDGRVLHAAEAATLKAATENAVAVGAYLAGADLAGADLAGVNLAGVNLAGVNLAGANLARVNLAGVNLAGANLARVNLAGANLAGADLAVARINWQSHWLLAALLRRAAGDDVGRRMVAGLVAISTDWCWDRFLALDHPERVWALETLAACVRDGDGAPEVLRRLVRERAAGAAGGAGVAVRHGNGEAD